MRLRRSGGRKPVEARLIFGLLLNYIFCMRDKKQREVRARILVLIRALDFDTNDAFATAIGTNGKNLSAILARGELPRVWADAIVHRFAGITRDWLYDGTEGGLSVLMLRRLQAAAGSQPDPNKPRRGRPPVLGRLEPR